LHFPIFCPRTQREQSLALLFWLSIHHLKTTNSSHTLDSKKTIVLSFSQKSHS
jgi:hypothetical protein